jgi:DNA mismatch endonuclease, patch repair protein
MEAQPRRETGCETAVRSAVHALGLRYRVHRRPEADLRREADLVFPREKVAVFVDGCFWHGCPEHHRVPTAHSEWWAWKFERTRARDEQTDRVLRQRGWVVVRVWEHEEPGKAARRVRNAVARRRRAQAEAKR